MSMLRGLLFDNLGLKLAALLLAVMVYLNVYLDRPSAMIVSFPIEFEDIGDSLTLSGPVPGVLQAELRGTGKQLVRLRVTEPPLRVSLAGVGPGRFERPLTAEDLPLAGMDNVQVDRLVGPTSLDLRVERRGRRRIPVAPRLEGRPAAGVLMLGVIADPESLLVTGPASVLAALDSVVLQPARVQGKRDTVRAQVGPEALPDWCVADPALVKIVVPLRRGGP